MASMLSWFTSRDLKQRAAAAVGVDLDCRTMRDLNEREAVTDSPRIELPGLVIDEAFMQLAGTFRGADDVELPAHFAVLREANLVQTEKDGKSVIYHLNLSVLEDALMGFANTFGIGAERPSSKRKSTS